MQDGRPSANIWGNIITCGEIALGIYEIVGDKNKGIIMSKADAGKILPEAVAARGEPEGENLCFTDELSTALVGDELVRQKLVTDPEFIIRQEAAKQLDDAERDNAYEPLNEIDFEELELER
jgi:hypothetical protein